MIIGNRLSRNRAHMRWIDTHCHLDAAEFAADRTAVWQRACAAGVTMAVIPAVAADTFDAVRGLAHELGLAYALGIHPLCVDRAAYEDLDRLRDALQRHADDPRLVAVGEIGLDWFVLDLFLLRGQAQLDNGRRTHFLPGPCAYYWHSIEGIAPQPLTMPTAPEWATRPLPLKPEMAEALGAVSLRLLKEGNAVEAALEAALKDPEQATRILAVLCLGAIDDLPALLAALEDNGHAGVRGTAAFIKDEVQRWGHVIRENKIVLE